jgi:MvaI/BcnI restriction endonuclease family
MRQLTDIEIDRIKLLTEKSVELCLIEPTQTGLGKSIMDATGSVRSYLKSKNIHDFKLQNKGPESKVQVDSFLIEKDTLRLSKASLYRPVTKRGDPRIWFSSLSMYAKANDILGIIEFQKKLYVLNITQLDIKALLNQIILNPLKEIVDSIRTISNLISDELLFKLRKIAERGFVPALVNADTGIGRTLEYLLDIPMNSSKNPDYKGIELKSFRELRGTRKGLFGKTPNWELSKFKSRVEILDNFGYWEKGIFRLYNTIRATGRNAQGLILKTDYELDYLIENSDKPHIGDFLIWELEVLKKALLAKHKETFWIKAESRKEGDNEFFLFKAVEHTKNPLVNQLGFLIDIGAITMDYPIKRLPDGNVIDKGCNFKLKPNALELLFPQSQSYNLLA